MFRIFEKFSFSRFWPKMVNFCYFLPFLAKKIRFLDIFFESAYQICLKLGQKFKTVALNHLMAVLCLGQFLFWPFWPFLGQNTLLVVRLYGFGLFFAIFFQTVDDILLIFVIKAKFIACKWSITEESHLCMKQ